MALDTGSENTSATKRHAIEVGLEDGQTISADVGELGQATSEIRALNDTLNTGGFVVIGDRALVRSQEVKYVLLHESEDKDESKEGFLSTLKSRVQGGDDM